MVQLGCLLHLQLGAPSLGRKLPLALGQRKLQKELRSGWRGPHPARAQGDLSASPFSALVSTCPPAPEAQGPRGTGAVPTSLASPSALWVHIQGLRWSLHCPHQLSLAVPASRECREATRVPAACGGQERTLRPSMSLDSQVKSLVAAAPSTSPLPHPRCNHFILQPGCCPQGPRFSPGPRCWGPGCAHSPASVPRQRAARPFPSPLQRSWCCGRQACWPVVSVVTPFIHSIRRAPQASVLGTLFGSLVTESCKRHLFCSNEYFLWKCVGELDTVADP